MSPLVVRLIPTHQGNYEGVIEATHPDGTKRYKVKVPVEVTDNRSDADKYEPTVEGEK